MPRAAISTKQLFGPYFFEELVNKGIHLIKLSNWFVPQPERLELFGQELFQQDKAPSHHAVTVTEFLDGVFRDDEWIGRGSQQFAAPLKCPLRLPVTMLYADSSNRGLPRPTYVKHGA
jgi:hypothetical protein